MVISLVTVGSTIVTINAKLLGGKVSVLPLPFLSPFLCQILADHRRSVKTKQVFLSELVCARLLSRASPARVHPLVLLPRDLHPRTRLAPRRRLGRLGYVLHLSSHCCFLSLLLLLHPRQRPKLTGL